MPPPGQPDPADAPTALAAEQCAAANNEILKAKKKSIPKRGKYNDFSEEERLAIAQAACLDGPQEQQKI